MFSVVDGAVLLVWVEVLPEWVVCMCGWVGALIPPCVNVGLCACPSLRLEDEEDRRKKLHRLTREIRSLVLSER